MYFLIKVGIICFAGRPLILRAVFFHCTILSVPRIRLALLGFLKYDDDWLDLSSFLICFLHTFDDHLPGFLRRSSQCCLGKY